MGDLVCPHCVGTVPRGASVCRGCSAEIEYGAPKWAHMVSLVIGLIAGAKVYTILPKDLFWIGIVVAGGVFFVAGKYANKLFAKRVIFRRIYRTR